MTHLVGGDADTSYAFTDTGFIAVPGAEMVAKKIEEARVVRHDQAEAEIIEEMQEDYQGCLRSTGYL